MNYDKLLKSNLVPDSLIRRKIRDLLNQRLNDEDMGNSEIQQEKLKDLIQELKNSPIAIHTDKANEQHYELPTEFFKTVLGPHLKYSSGYWYNGSDNIEKSEKDMMELYTQRAEFSDGMDILELGCGWGSLTLFLGSKYPNSNITAVSNSATQKAFIDSEAQKRGINNIEIITKDINDFSIDKKFDRAISIEMFEHMRNYKQLLKLVSDVLKDDGKLFVHIFSHKDIAYKFEVKDETDWMSKYFFTGGIMPSDDLFFYFNDDMLVENHWLVNGKHYQRTSEAWLKRMDENKKTLMPIFEKTYGKENASLWFAYWRIFFMSCAELFGFRNGNEWGVSHYLFKKRQA